MPLKVHPATRELRLFLGFCLPYPSLGFLGKFLVKISEFLDQKSCFAQSYYSFGGSVDRGTHLIFSHTAPVVKLPIR